MFLKQNTAITLSIGPFLDETDGDTAETGLTIAQADVRLSKNHSTFTQKNESSSAVHDENGFYRVSLNSTDTNTVGKLRVYVNLSGAGAVWEDFIVLPESIYEWFIAGNGPVFPLGTESYAADGSQPNLSQAIYMILSMLFEKTISGTTLTTKKLDGTTTAMTFTLDSSTNPSSVTRSS